MLSVDVSFAAPFLPPSYEAQLRPHLAEAAQRLQNGDGKGKNLLGWVTLPRDYDRAEYLRIQTAARKIREDSRSLVVIGIGGSYLSAHGMIDCLCSPNYNLKKKSTPNVYFAGNSLSSAALSEIIELLGDDDFSVNVISKSGTTLESAVAFRFFRKLLEEKYGKAGAAGRIYATTDRSRGALKALADAEGYQTFTIPGNIGGRYSALTAVGLLPAAAAGIDIDLLMAGAQEMMTACAGNNPADPARQYAAARNALYRCGKKIELLASFEPNFQGMAQWWKQLFAESEGKELRGLFPASVSFPADLHSMGQYIQQGERCLFETVVRFSPEEAQLAIPFYADDADGLNYLSGKTPDFICRQAADGSLHAHAAGGVPNIIVNCGKNDACTLGRLIYFFEYACALSGYLLGINPFDQPGVEVYKKNMFALLGEPHNKPY